jgi:hypothetical protein
MPDGDRGPQINISRIPVGGGIGALAAIVILLAVLLGALPQLRWLAVYGVGTGLVFGVALILWRRRR